MIESLTNEPAVATNLRLILTIAFFALIGATYTVWGAYKNGEQWDSSKARGEIVALAAAGAAAGIYTLFVGGDIGGVVFGAAVAVAGHVAREGYAISTTSRDHYDELRDNDADPAQAALLAVRHGMDENNPDEVIEGVRALLELGGKPSQAAANERADRLEQQYREDGLRGAADDVLDDGASWSEPSEVEDIRRAHTSDDADPADEEHYVGDGGDGDDATPEDGFAPAEDDLSDDDRAKLERGADGGLENAAVEEGG